MRREVVWITPGTSIAEASQLMLDKGVRSLLFVTKKRGLWALLLIQI